MLLQGGNGFPYPSPDAEYSDLAITHYPNGLLIQRSIVQNHQIPLWSPQILSGYPFAANPLSGLWYPPGWIALLFPLPFGFNLTAALHLLWGGYWLYRLLKLEGLSTIPSIFGAYCFMLMPKLYAHYGAGHLTLLYAVCHTPLFLFAVAKTRSHGAGGLQALRRGMLGGVVLAGIILADIRWSVYAILAWGFFILFRSVWIKPFRLKSLLLSAGSTLITGILLSAVLLLPFMQYTSLSTRAALDPAESMVYSLPVSRILGFLTPFFNSSHEWTVYMGIVPLFLILCMIFQKKGDRSHWLWLSLITIGILLALGENFLPIRWLYALPGMRLLRVPSRAVFLVGMGFSMMVAIGLDTILHVYDSIRWRWVNLAAVASASFISFIAIGIGITSGNVPWNFIWGSGLVLVSWLWLRFYPRLENRFNLLWLIGVFLLITVDLVVMDGSLLSYRGKDDVVLTGESVLEQIIQDSDQFRVYSASYSVSQEIAAYYHLELADGIDPMQLSTYVEYMATATGIESEGYSVTLPPFKTGDPATDNLGAVPDVKLLGELNVKYVAAEFEIHSPGLELIDWENGIYFYINENWRPRAVLYPADHPVEAYSVVRIDEYTPNHTIMTVEGPGQLVLSELDYPGWQVRIDGEKAPIQITEEIFRSVEVPAGMHQVEFYFRPRLIFGGLSISIVAAVIVLTTLAYISHSHE